MVKKWLSTYVIGLAVILNGQYALACSVAYISSPEELVSSAELIVLATALDYVGSSPGSSRTTGVAETTVRFRVESVLKGTYTAADLSLNGYVEAFDDWNDQPVPYTFVRRNGRHGSCFANTYGRGSKFVLMLKRGTNLHLQGRTEYTVNWAALAPVNEQIKSADDPWVQWVRQQIQIQNAKTFCVSLRTDQQQFTAVDPARLSEIEKRMDEIDFWNAGKFRRVLALPRNPTCPSPKAEKIEITAVRGIPKSLLFWNTSCPAVTTPINPMSPLRPVAAAADTESARELLGLIEMIHRAAP